eukprot:gene7798-7237_t
MAEDGQWARVWTVAGVGHRVGGAIRTKASASLLSRGFRTPRPGPPQPMMVAVHMLLVSLHVAAAAAAATAAAA